MGSRRAERRQQSRDRRARVRRELFRLGSVAGRSAWRWASSQPIVQRQVARVEAQIDELQGRARARLRAFEEDFWDWVKQLDDERSSHGPLRAGPSLTECYRLLEVTASTSNDALRKAWRAQMSLCHPDRFARDPQQLSEAEERARRVNEAYQTICRARGI
jgi:DnaJ-domain-containing protein 1